MNEIVFSERPDNVTWEDIRNNVIEAHKKNLEKGLVVRSTTLSAKQLCEQVGDGKCFVALDGTKVVGVAAVRIKQCNQWYCQGKVAHFLLDSISIDYQGMGIYSQLQKMRYSFVKEQGISIITTNTAENNVRMVKMLPKHGFHRAVLFRIANTGHYSINWVKWLKEEPSYLTCWCHYRISVLKTKARCLLHKVSISIK